MYRRLKAIGLYFLFGLRYFVGYVLGKVIQLGRFNFRFSNDYFYGKTFGIEVFIRFATRRLPMTRPIRPCLEKVVPDKRSHRPVDYLGTSSGLEPLRYWLVQRVPLLILYPLIYSYLVLVVYSG